MLSVENISAQRAGRVLFQNVNLTLRPSQALAIIGRNGAGKTTLLRILAGLTLPLTGYLDYLTRKTLYIGHKNALNPYLTPTQTIVFWARLFDIKMLNEDAIKEILSLFQLDKHANDMCGELSLGQTKRLSLSRLLFLPHPIWLLDEPLSGLDSAGVDFLENHIAKHLENDGIVIAATHVDIRFINETLDINQFSPQKENA